MCGASRAHPAAGTQRPHIATWRCGAFSFSMLDTLDTKANVRAGAFIAKHGNDVLMVLALVLSLVFALRALHFHVMTPAERECVAAALR